MDLQPAKFWRRIAALLYDSLIALGLLMFTSILLVIANRGHAIAPGQWWFTCLLLAVLFAYFGTCWLRGQTIGMYTWRLHIVTADQQPLTWWHAAMRFGYACPALLCAGLGLWWSVWDKDHLAWHDRWSGTALKYAPATPSPSRRKSTPATTPPTVATNE